MIAPTDHPDGYMAECAHVVPPDHPDRAAEVAKYKDGCVALYGDDVCVGCTGKGLRQIIETYTAFDDPVDWLAWRMFRPLPSYRVRRTGRSSDALTMWALGKGPRPYTPGTPCAWFNEGAGPRRPGGWKHPETGRSYPSDVDDLNACERTYATAPLEYRERLDPVIREFRQWVHQGINRHGVHIDQSKPGPLDLFCDVCARPLGPDGGMVAEFSAAHGAYKRCGFCRPAAL